MANPETLLGEIEAKTRELIGTVIYAQIHILSVSRFSYIYIAATLNISHFVWFQPNGQHRCWSTSKIRKLRNR